MTMLGDKPYTFDRVVRMAVTLGVLYALVRVMAYLSDALIPFIIAFLVAYLLDPVVDRVQTWVRHRAAAVFVTLAGLVLLLALLGGVLAPVVTKEVSHMGQLVSRLVTDSDLAARASEKLPEDVWKNLRAYAGQERIRELLGQKDFWSLSAAVGKKVLPGVWGLVAGTTNFLLGVMGVFVVLLYLVFMLIDYDRLREEWEGLIPRGWRRPVLDFLRDFDQAMSRYFRAQAVVAATVGVLFAAGFAVIGLPMGILLGLFVGLLNMVPYLQLVALVPASLLAVVMALEGGTSILAALGLTGLVFAVVQTLQDTVIVPKVMGRATGLSPAMILLSVTVWGKLLGFLGLVVALPATCLCLAYYRRLLKA